MVAFNLPFPQIVFFILGLAAALIFILEKFFHISNKMMAVFSTSTFLGILLLILSLDRISTMKHFKFLGFMIEPKIIVSTESFYLRDPGATLLIGIAVGLAALVSLYSAEYLNLDHRQQVFYPLLMLMVCGFVGMLYASNLMAIYLFSELMSICTYALVAFRRQTDTAIEAGFKYLIMGSTASIVILFGITILFFFHGTMNISEIINSSEGIPISAALLIFSGFCLKSALVPLHTWLPDAHGRAPSSISAILSGVMVQGAFYTMVRLLLVLDFDARILGTLLLILSLLSILIGNLLGLVQTHTKRLLGYSTISQMGYITLCIAIGLRNDLTAAFQAGFFIIVIHALSKSLAFLCKGVFHYYFGISEIRDLDKASDFTSLISTAFGLSLISLAAIPPIAGFTGKWMALASFFASSDRLTLLGVLVFLAGSLLALGYYFPLIVRIFKNIAAPTKATHQKKRKRISAWMSIPIALLCSLILFISASPQIVIDQTEKAASFLAGLMR